MNKVKVYRNGSLTPATYTGEVQDFALAADALRVDAARPGRVGSLYASPSLPGVVRWTRANLDLLAAHRDDLETYELTVDADAIYVYDIAKWEDYSWHGKSAEDYWKTGITLTEYLRREVERDDTNWEILLAPEHILSSRRVSAKRLIEHAQYQDEMRDTLKRHGVR